MFKFLLIILFFLLPGCGERHCIKPESLSNLREKSDIVSTQQKWVNSGVNISDRIRITEINIIPSELNFCPNQYEDFIAANEGFVAASSDINFEALGLTDGDPVTIINEQISYLEELKKQITQNPHEKFEDFKNMPSGKISYCFTNEWYEKGVESAKGSTKWQTWKDVPLRIDNKRGVGDFSALINGHIKACIANKNYFESFSKHTVSLPFELKKGDSISFSVVENKMCKNNENDEERYVKIDEKCGEKETEYFAKVLNQEECKKSVASQGGICPNKYTIGNAGWLNGKEYWNSDLSNSDQDEKKKEIENIINSIKQGQKIDCSKLSESSKNKIDTYILNSMCNNMCHTTHTNCVEGESYLGDKDLFRNLSLVIGIHDSTSTSDDDRNNDIINLMKLFREEVETKEMKTYIPSLKITMANENFEHPQGGIRTNYDYTIENDHPKGKNLTFIFGKAGGKGGYNMRVTKNYSLKDNLYIHVSNSFPKHKPGEKNENEDIPVNINKVYDSQYMEDLQEKLKNKNGTIYYGIRDHGCDYKNDGKFSISLTIKEPPIKTFSTIYNFFDRKVKEAFFGSSYEDANVMHSETSPTKSLYQSFVASNRTNTMRSTIISLLVLYIVLYTLYYFFGLSHISIYEFLIICVKIGIITQLLQDNSWDFFYNNAFSMFINAPKQLIGIANFRGTTSNVFEFLDLPLNRFFSPHSVLLIVSLIFSGPLGIVAFCLVIWGLITVVLSLFNALFSFITSIAIIALLLSLAPIFIICVLFKYTRQMFNSWVGQLLRFAIHPVIMLIFISLISQVMDYIVYSVFDFEVCTTCILDINLRIFRPCILYAYASKYTPNITAMMSFVILGHAMKALIKASSAISDSLSNVFVQTEPGKQYKQSLLGIVGLDQESVQRRGGSGGGSGGASQASSTANRRPQIPQSAQRPSGK